MSDIFSRLALVELLDFLDDACQSGADDLLQSGGIGRRTRRAQQADRVFIDIHRGGNRAHGLGLLGRQAVFVDIEIDLLGAQDRCVVHGVIEDRQRELGQFLATFRADPDVRTAIFADVIAAIFGHIFFAAACVEPAFFADAIGGDDAVGAGGNVAVGIAGVKLIHAGLAIGAMLRGAAVTATADGLLIGAAHEFELARVVDRSEREGFLALARSIAGEVQRAKQQQPKIFRRKCGGRAAGDGAAEAAGKLAPPESVTLAAPWFG